MYTDGAYLEWLSTRPVAAGAAVQWQSFSTFTLDYPKTGPGSSASHAHGAHTYTQPVDT